MTIKEQACCYETMKHVERVRNLLNQAVRHLLKRGEEHDKTKFAEPELSAYTEHTPILKTLEYGSPEYIENARKLGPALQNHYSKNRHHPEYHKNGIDDMNLVDLIELFVDWKAASERNKNGNLNLSIEKNGDRFKMSPQLIKIFENSVDLFE